MIKVIKLGNLIYERIEPKTVDENGNEVWNIPNDPDQLKFALNDTLGWLVAQKILKTVGSADKKDASVSKSVMLLAKIISTLNPDLSSLTTKEQSAFRAMVDLANTGYTDSDLLNNMLTELNNHLAWYAKNYKSFKHAIH